MGGENCGTKKLKNEGGCDKLVKKIKNSHKNVTEKKS
jgi:hypothetical protein